MSKATIIVIILGILIALAIYFFTDFNPATSLYSLLQNPLDSVSNWPAIITENWQTLTGTVGGIAAAASLAKMQLNRTKEQAQQTQNVMQGQMIELTQANAKLEGLVDAQKETIADQAAKIGEKQAEIKTLEKTISAKDAQIQRLTNDLSYGQKAEKDWVKQQILEATQKP